VAAKLGVPQSTLSKFLKSHDTLNANMTSEKKKKGSLKENVMQ
jgi:hypothetical protein